MNFPSLGERASDTTISNRDNFFRPLLANLIFTDMVFNFAEPVCGLNFEVQKYELLFGNKNCL